jgi:hypothetical protein
MVVTLLFTNDVETGHREGSSSRSPEELHKSSIRTRSVKVDSHHEGKMARSSHRGERLNPRGGRLPVITELKTKEGG